MDQRDDGQIGSEDDEKKKSQISESTSHATPPVEARASAAAEDEELKCLVSWNSDAVGSSSVVDEAGHEDSSDPVPEKSATSASAVDRPGDRARAREVSGISSTPPEANGRAVPPSSLALSGSRPRRRKVLVAPALSLSLGESMVSDDFSAAFLSPSFDDDEDLDIDLDAMETPSDSESFHFPTHDLDLEEDLQRLGVASWRSRVQRSSPSSRGSGSGSGADLTGLGSLDQDTVDGDGVRWRCFTTGHPPQEGRVNMSVIEPYLRVLSHGGYYGDGMNDIIVFSSCYLPENSLDNYQYVMDNLFRYVVGTLELMVAENYVIIYLCAMAQKDKLPGIGWLKECYTTIDRRLRKNLKGLFVVHPTWYIKAVITIIKPFISSKFSRKLQFVSSLQELSHYIPTEHVQIPDCVRQYDNSLER